jgi:hypothetical protein
VICVTAGALIILAFVSSLGALVAAMFRSGTRDILIAIAAFYIFWAFGPVINYLVGVPIYFGTVESQIAQASIIFFLGTMGILLPAIITSSKNEQGKTTALRKAHSLSILALIEVVLILWFVLRLPGLLSHHGSMNKVDFVSHFRTQHYSYLMIQIYVTAFFFQARGTLLQRWLYNINFISY